MECVPLCTKTKVPPRELVCYFFGLRLHSLLPLYECNVRLNSEHQISQIDLRKRHPTSNTLSIPENILFCILWTLTETAKGSRHHTFGINNSMLFLTLFDGWFENL